MVRSCIWRMSYVLGASGAVDTHPIPFCITMVFHLLLSERCRCFPCQTIPCPTSVQRLMPSVTVPYPSLFNVCWANDYPTVPVYHVYFKKTHQLLVHRNTSLHAARVWPHEGYIMKWKNFSCEIDDFVETRLCMLRGILRSRVLRVLCDLIKTVSPCWGGRNRTAVELS